MDAEGTPIPGYRHLYRATRDGRIISMVGKKARVLKPFLSRAGKGYNSVSMPKLEEHQEGKFFDYELVYIADLILRTFVGPRPAGHEIEHLDGNTRNDALENLRWSLAKHNQTRIAAKTRRPDWKDQL